MPLWLDPVDPLDPGDPGDPGENSGSADLEVKHDSFWHIFSELEVRFL